MLSFFTSLLILTLNAQSYILDEHLNCNNVDNAVPNPGESTKYVRFLGVLNSTDACIQECVQKSTTTNQCNSYTFHTEKFKGDYQNHCYGRFGSPYGLFWAPINQDNINCGRVIFPCKSDLDCELNGKCNLNTGNCSCRAGWTGYHCQQLNLQKATKGTGYHITDDNNSGKPTSSWGGGVIVDQNDPNDDTKYHMFLAEFQNHCGVDSWTLNSVVTHAQSTKGYNSPYERVEILHQHFAHEPNVVRGPNNEIVIYYSAYNYSTNVKECECSDGSTPPSCQPPGAHFINLMDWSPSGSPNGPWQRSVIFPTTRGIPSDTNLAGVIAKNGSFLGMMRYWIGGSEMHLVTSTDWKDGRKYVISEPLLFPQLTSPYTEDPSLYMDCNGNYHAIFHNMDPFQFAPPNGGHAFSEDGINWIYGGSSWQNVIQFTDGTSFTFNRLERPHFIFADDGCTPIALTNGVQYGGRYGDATYTSLQPIAH